MSFQIRRVVTGHDETGMRWSRPTATRTNVMSLRPGLLQTVIWATDQSPASNDGDDDPSQKPVGTAQAGGTVFRIIEYGVGVTPRVHRTN